MSDCGCGICSAMGLHWAQCASCGIEFVWRRWDVEDDGLVDVAVRSESLGDREAYYSPSWLPEAPADHCEQCDPHGYAYPPSALAPEPS